MQNHCKSGAESKSSPTHYILSDDNLRVSEIDFDVPNGRREVAYPGIPLILINGMLEPAPSWWLLDMVKRRTPADTLITYRKSIALWFKILNFNRLDWYQCSAPIAQGFIDALIRRGNTENTVITRTAAVLAFYKWALSRGFLSQAPFTKQDLRIPKGQSRSVEAHSKADFDKIVEKLPRMGPGVRRRDELICECGRFLGLRRKEITGLMEADFLALDPEKSLNVIATNAKFTKYGKSRPVLVPRLLLVKLRNYIEVYRSQVVRRRRMADPIWMPPPNLFLTQQGNPVSEAYITDTWKRASREAGVNSRFHNNRSSYATHAADVAEEFGKLPTPIVKDLLGHVREATADRYINYNKLRRRLLMDAHVINDMYVDEQRGTALERVDQDPDEASS